MPLILERERRRKKKLKISENVASEAIIDILPPPKEIRACYEYGFPALQASMLPIEMFWTMTRVGFNMA